jgi:hypothetical protein
VVVEKNVSIPQRFFLTTTISGCSLFDFKQITIIIPNKRQGPVPLGDMSNLNFQVVTFIQERIQIAKSAIRILKSKIKDGA